MSKNDFLVVFDFDGVLWNSVYECFYIGELAYRQMGFVHKAVRKTAIKRFEEGRHLVQRAEDFFLVFWLVHEQPNIDLSVFPKEEFFKMRADNERYTSEFAEIFYRERSNLQKNSFTQWLSLQTPQSGVFELLPQIKEMFADVAVATTKDAMSIQKIFAIYNQKYLVVSREHAKDKDLQVAKISVMKNIPLNKIFFIDDNLENILRVHKTDANAFLASWGYNTVKEREECIRNGIPSLKKESFLDDLVKVANRMSQICAKKS